MLVNVVNICEEGEWPSLLFSIWKSSDSAEAESGIASPSMSNLYPVMVPESELRNAEEGNGKRQWSGFVLSQKLFPDIDIFLYGLLASSSIFAFAGFSYDSGTIILFRIL